MTMNPPEALPENHDPKPQAPIEPPLEACCNSGCYPCVFDVYTEELQQYRLDLAAWQARQGGDTPLPASI
ncbi:oxidoreductase-like domain-containing protein [uncultured Deefgea sp.]|uniref:oxidoreductase-like domain-containing protein n=1 Tax=uncultured Deefgea sp. TaxID=1304914 RepID=UPI0026035839|nr:oxidoreductase-like domain-containing protein [uncultured Deefgea sp.]